MTKIPAIVKRMLKDYEKEDLKEYISKGINAWELLERKSCSVEGWIAFKFSISLRQAKTLLEWYNSVQEF